MDDQIGFAWTMKGVKKAQQKEKKEKTKKEPKPQVHVHIKKKQRVSKKADTASSSKSDNNVSTKMLEDGTQVIESNEKVKHADGSLADITTEESTQKRLLKLANGTRVLETTTKIVTTKIERMVIPPLPPPAEDDVLKEEEEMPKLEVGVEGEESEQPSGEGKDDKVEDDDKQTKSEKEAEASEVDAGEKESAVADGTIEV